MIFRSAASSIKRTGSLSASFPHQAVTLASSSAILMIEFFEPAYVAEPDTI